MSNLTLVVSILFLTILFVFLFLENVKPPEKGLIISIALIAMIFGIFIVKKDSNTNKDRPGEEGLCTNNGMRYNSTDKDLSGKYICPPDDFNCTTPTGVPVKPEYNPSDDSWFCPQGSCRGESGIETVCGIERKSQWRPDVCTAEGEWDCTMNGTQPLATMQKYRYLGCYSSGPSEILNNHLWGSSSEHQKTYIIDAMINHYKYVSYNDMARGAFGGNDLPDDMPSPIEEDGHCSKLEDDELADYVGNDNNNIALYEKIS